MSETLLTKCPHCSTTFRLTQAQLQIAGGAVRCGACYQVFHANEHIVKTAVVEEIRQPPAPKPDPIEEAFELNTDEGLDPYDAAEFDMDSPDADLFSEDYRKSMDAESTMDEFGFASPKPDKVKKGSDESWAEDMLKELGDDTEEEGNELIHDEMDLKTRKPGISSSASAFSLEDDEEENDKPAPKKKKSGDDLSDTFRTLGSFSSDDPFSISDIEEEEFSASSGDTDESWAKAMLEELEEEASPRKKTESLAIMAEEKPKDAGTPFGARELARNRREAVERAKAQQRLQPKAPKKPAAKPPATSLRNSETEDFFRMLEEPSPNSNTQHKEPSLEMADLDNLEDIDNDLRDAAVQPAKLFNNADDIINQQIKLSAMHFADEESPHHPWRNLLLVIGTLALILGGIGQYLYFNYDTVSRNPQMRPILEQICATLGCALSSPVDLDAIVGTNLVVRSHPHERNALVIDVIIKNKAAFEQPFPVVQLSFEDVNGNPMARRRFQPKEYIQDRSIDIQRMPPETPIHLTLEIVDPGKDAVNYQIQFLAAAPAP